MPDRRYHARAAELFQDTLAPDVLEEVARRSGLIRRRRMVTGTGLFWALMMALGGQRVEYISDVLRTMNAWQGWALRYKPFWNRLATKAFVAFSQDLFRKLSRELTTRVMSRSRGDVVAMFSDIRIDDGSSFAVADGLKRVFPGRFTKVTPAAVELHAHMSVMSDQLLSVSLAPDKEAERKFLPSPHTLPRRSLSLRDRGYVDLEYFAQLEEAEAYLICRAKRDIKPTIVEVLDGLPRRLRRRWTGRSLDALRAKKLRQNLDLLVAWQRPGGTTLTLRLCVRYVPEKRSWTWLLTNLPHAMVDAEAVGQLYRLRWQIELLFKDWKSYANLHAFQTQHPSIAEGFIWASLCAALLKRALAHWAQLSLPSGTRISTRLAAISGPQIMPLVAAWAMSGFKDHGRDGLLQFLVNNALRAHPNRDRRAPSWSLGLRPLVGARA
jgi:hypothetical protein